MTVKKELGHPYDATNSWNGYSHQGKIALWYAIQTIIKLWNDLDAEQNCKTLEEHFLELEYEEDFSIGKYSPDGNIYLSIHQVKARADTSIDSYKDAVLDLLTKVMKHSTIQSAYLHVSQDLQVSKEELLQKVNEFAQLPDRAVLEIITQRNDSKFREMFCASKPGRPTKIKAAVWSALQEKCGNETNLTEENLDQAFDAYLEVAENLPKASQAEREKICVFEYLDFPNIGSKQGYCRLNQVHTLLENAIVAYYKKTDPKGWKWGDSEHVHKMYLYLLGCLDKHVMERHLKRSEYLLEQLDRTISLSKIVGWLDKDIDTLGENYYLYYLKEELFKVLNEYCCDCSKGPVQCSKCHIADAKEKIGVIPYDRIKEFIYIISPHKSGKINMDSYASFANISGLQNPFARGLRDISVPFSSKADILPIVYYDAVRKQYVLTTIQAPETDGGKSCVCRKIVENSNVYSLLMDCDVLISKDIYSDSVWMDAEIITESPSNPRQMEHIAHCKDVKIVPLDDCQDSFVSEEEDA